MVQLRVWSSIHF